MSMTESKKMLVVKDEKRKTEIMEAGIKEAEALMEMGRNQCYDACFHCGEELKSIEVSEAESEINESEWCEFTFKCSACGKMTTRFFSYGYSFDPEAV